MTGKLIAMLLVGIVIGVAIGQQFNRAELEECHASNTPPANFEVPGDFDGSFSPDEGIDPNSGADSIDEGLNTILEASSEIGDSLVGAR